MTEFTFFFLCQKGVAKQQNTPQKNILTEERLQKEGGGQTELLQEEESLKQGKPSLFLI